MKQPLVETKDLSVRFPVRKDWRGRVTQALHAVTSVNLSIDPGTTLGLVGESGCGKSTLGRALLRLIEPTSGRVTFDGLDLRAASRRELRALRRHMQIVFQDPMGSLNPRMRVGDIVGEPLAIHRVGSRRHRRNLVAELFERVGLSASRMDRYPHEFSGGQRQRIGIARAVALRPKFIVCDEPVSALDVSVQAQILNLLSDLKRDLGLTYLFIAHNLAVVKHFSDQVAVMYLGRIVEQAAADELYANPRHPYTMALLAAVPNPDPSRRNDTKPSSRLVTGEAPDPVHLPQGCAYHTRCLFATEQCRTTQPPLRVVDGTPAHQAACHHLETIPPFV